MESLENKDRALLCETSRGDDSPSEEEVEEEEEHDVSPVKWEQDGGEREKKNKTNGGSILVYI